jgi:protein TonB
MKLLLPAVLLLVSISCQKINADLQAQPVTIKTESVAGTVDDAFFCIVPIEAEFPGGEDAWKQFLQRNLRYPLKAAKLRIQGMVIVQFIVGTDGTVSEIEAIKGPEVLRKCAIDVLKNSPKWIPGKMNGRNYKCYKRQPIFFRLEKE